MKTKRDNSETFLFLCSQEQRHELAGGNVLYCQQQ